MSSPKVIFGPGMRSIPVRFPTCSFFSNCGNRNVRDFKQVPLKCNMCVRNGRNIRISRTGKQGRLDYFEDGYLPLLSDFKSEDNCVFNYDVRQILPNL